MARTAYCMFFFSISITGISVFLLAQKRLEWKLEKYRIEIMT